MSRNRFIALSVLLDSLLLNAGIVAAFLLRFGGSLPSFNFAAYLVLAPFITAAYLAASWAYGLYDPERSADAWTIVRLVAIAVTVSTVITAAIAFFGGPRTASFARLTILIAWALEFVFLVGWRLIFLHFGRIRWPEQRALIIGVGPMAVELAVEMSSRSQWGWRVVGLVDPSVTRDCEVPDEVGGFRVLGCAPDAARIAAETGANRIVVVSPVALRELVESLVLADEARVRVDVVPELYEIFIGTVDQIVGDVPLMEITRSTVPRYFAAAKRAVDFLLASVLLVLLSPLLLVAALGIIATDGFPVVFRQERMGKHLKPFDVLKLRTMVKDAEKLSGPVLAEQDDPRITRVGRVLRNYRIDELPQLVNILAGDMSFVGPRPERPFFVERHLVDIPGYRERFNVKPGVTGLAQVSGGYATTPERKLKYDLIYMYHQDFAMDAQIIAETLKVVLTGRGAR